MTYVIAIRGLSTGDEWFKQDADEQAAQQKRQYQLLVYCCPCALQRPDHTPIDQRIRHNPNYLSVYSSLSQTTGCAPSYNINDLHEM